MFKNLQINMFYPKHFISFSFLILFIVPSISWADQCAWNSEKVAKEALKVLGPHKHYLDYCEPCGQKEPKKIYIKSVNMGPAKMGDEIQDGYFEVSINGAAKDIAYVFVRKKGTENEWQNLGDLAKCRDQSISGTIEEVAYPAKKSPVEQKQEKTKNYVGTFENKKNQVKIVLKRQKLHGPDWLKINIGIISSEWGDSRGGMVGYLQFNHKKPTYFSAFDKCAFFMEYEPAKNGIGVRANKECGSSLKDKLTGFYKKK